MHRGIRAAVAMLAFVALVGGAAPALAKAGDVVKEGPCSASSNWKLKLSDENGRIEVEFEVDSNVNGQRWQVAVNQNGSRIFTGSRTTQAPSGSFELRLVTNNLAGPDTFQAGARNPATGETCLAMATFPS